MDMELSEEQQRLMETARRFLEDKCPLSLVREMETSELGYSREAWREMAELGWLGLPYPQEYGGFGMASVDLVVLSKELGRALCPSPYTPTVVLGGGAIAAAGTEAQKKAYLPQIIAGETIIAFALQEPSAEYGPEGIEARAAEAEGGFVLSGTKMFVEFASAADRLLVVARTSGEPPSSERPWRSRRATAA